MSHNYFILFGPAELAIYVLFCIACLVIGFLIGKLSNRKNEDVKTFPMNSSIRMVDMRKIHSQSSSNITSKEKAEQLLEDVDELLEQIRSHSYRG